MIMKMKINFTTALQAVKIQRYLAALGKISLNFNNSLDISLDFTCTTHTIEDIITKTKMIYIHININNQR